MGACRCRRDPAWAWIWTATSWIATIASTSSGAIVTSSRMSADPAGEGTSPYGNADVHAVSKGAGAMQAVIVSAPGSVSIERLPDPEPQPDEVVVRVRGCGICGTDLHIIHE